MIEGTARVEIENVEALTMATWSCAAGLAIESCGCHPWRCFCTNIKYRAIADGSCSRTTSLSISSP